MGLAIIMIHIAFESNDADRVKCGRTVLMWTVEKYGGGFVQRLRTASDMWVDVWIIIETCVVMSFWYRRWFCRDFLEKSNEAVGFIIYLYGLIELYIMRRTNYFNIISNSSAYYLPYIFRLKFIVKSFRRLIGGNKKIFYFSFFKTYGICATY